MADAENDLCCKGCDVDDAGVDVLVVTGDANCGRMERREKDVESVE